MLCGSQAYVSKRSIPAMCDKCIELNWKGKN